MSLLISFVLYVPSALAFSCPRDNSLETRFTQSTRVMLVQITDTRLEENLAREVQVNLGLDDFIPLVSVGYKVLEDFKGNPSEIPRLLDILAVGTGFVNFTPGVYNLVFMGPKSTNLDTDYRRISICDIVHHRRLDDPSLQKAINTVRKLRDRPSP